jgi:hypothetical protein
VRKDYHFTNSKYPILNSFEELTNNSIVTLDDLRNTTFESIALEE